MPNSATLYPAMAVATVSEPSVPGVRGAIFGDTRDITPFRNGHVRTSVGGLAEGLSGAIWGVLKGKAAGRIDVAGDVPRLKRLAGKTAKSVYDAVFTSTEPDRLITLARTLPRLGWPLLRDCRAACVQTRWISPGVGTAAAGLVHPDRRRRQPVLRKLPSQGGHAGRGSGAD